MKCSKCLRWMLLPLVLLLSVPAAHAAARKVDAPTLLGLAESGLSQTLRAARASGGRLDPSRPEQRPFWSSLDKMGAALQRVRAGMRARDSSFFRALEDGSADLAELKVVWARTGAPDLAVSGALRVLSSSYGLLRTGYGREAVRHRMGLGLLPAERARFLRIQRTQERLAQVLRDLEERARQRGDETMRAELRRMAEEAWRVASAQLTLDAYLNALMIADSQRGEWTANTHYASTDDRSEWLEAGTVVEELYVEADIGQVFMVDLGDVQEPEPAAPPTPGTLAPPAASVATMTPSAMSYLDEPTELPEELAQAVETYQPASEAAYLVDEIDPVEEEEALAEEEMADETGAEEGSDLAVYEDIEDPDAESETETETETETEIEAAEESEVEVEDLPIEPVEPIEGDTTTAPAPKTESRTGETATPAPSSTAPDKKETGKPPV